MINELLIILGLILMNGLLTMAEMAIISSKKSRLESFAKKGSGGSKTALDLASKPTRFLSMVQIGISLTGILTGIFSAKSLIGGVVDFFIQTGLSPEYASGTGVFLVVLAITFFSLVLGELVPKRIGLHSPERIAAFLAPMMKGISRIAAPFIWLLSVTTDAILNVFGINSQAEEAQVTEEEVKELIAQGTNSGAFEELEQDMMERVLLLGDRSVASLMTNRIEVEWLDVNAGSPEILEKIVNSNHSLFPVCDDEIDKVVGVLNSKKFLVALQSEKQADLRSLMSPARVIPENMKALAALEEFKANKTKIAVVVDEYGSVQGVLTQSDLFESIVAEHDTPDEENEISIVQREENSYLIDALLPFEEFLQYFEIEDVAPEDRTGFHSLGGFILHLSKQIPSTGDRFEWKNYEFEVVDMDGNRIDKLLVNIREGETE
jgi:putative hemolysin